MFLPDVNLWLALTFESHFHHPQAKSWFDTLACDACLFCRMTQQGFLRLSTNTRVLLDDAVSMRDAWILYDTLQHDPRVGFAVEPTGIELHWRRYTDNAQHSPKVWNDAYLAAFARAASLTTVTFDRGRSQHPNVPCVVLS